MNELQIIEISTSESYLIEALHVGELPSVPSRTIAEQTEADDDVLVSDEIATVESGKTITFIVSSSMQNSRLEWSHLASAGAVRDADSLLHDATRLTMALARVSIVRIFAHQSLQVDDLQGSTRSVT